MELLATLGQYLLLTFVLPGCCYAVAFALGCPDTFRDVRAAAAPPLDSAGQKVGKGISQGYWLAFIVFTGGCCCHRSASRSNSCCDIALVPKAVSPDRF